MTPPPFALVADAWFDGTRHHDHAVTLQVTDGTIRDIAAGDHAAALAARGWAVERGAFLMPGLVDAHVHLFLDGRLTDPAARSAHLKQDVESLTACAQASARHALNSGVTLVRDAGDRHGINNQVRRLARDPASGMAAVRSGGLGVKRAKRYGAFMATDVDDDASIRASVRALSTDNDEIKLILTGVIDFDAGAVTDTPQFTVDAARLVVDTAHACGRKVFAHCSGALGLEVAIAAGVDSIEHGFFMRRDLLAQMRDRGLAWTPTFCPVHAQWADPEPAGWSVQTIGNLRRILDDHAEHVRLAQEMGVRLLVGTDAGSMGVPHGDAVFDEIERFVEAGLSIDAALTAATSAPREHFGMNHPTLAAGSPFDAVLLEASPRAGIRALRHPRRVWRDGVEARR